MKCFEREQLFAFAHGMLETRQAAEARAHLETCLACRQVVAEYQRLDAALDEWKSIEPSAWFDARVRQAVKEQREAQASSLRSRLFALTWVRWLAPASLAVLVGVVALNLYRSHRFAGPAVPGSSAQRISPAAAPAAQPSTETSQEAVVQKKPAPAAIALSAKHEPGSLAKLRAPAQAGQGVAEAHVEPAAPTPAVEAQRALARATGERAATPQPLMGESVGGALAWRAQDQANRPQRVLQAAPSAVASAEAPPQVTPAPAAATASVAVTPGPVARQMTAMPLMSPPAAKALLPAESQAPFSALPQPSVPAPPGLLETFLADHPDAVLTKRELGTLEGRGATRATFTAVVASDPADPTKKVKGLEVHLEDGVHKATLYLDDDRGEETPQDSLRAFQQGLDRWADKDKVLEYWRSDGRGESYRDLVISVPNRLGGHAVIDVGWYKHGEELGVAIASLSPRVWYYFPGVELAEVVKIIAAGRAFLDSN
jgi:hypothetical protein